MATLYFYGNLGSIHTMDTSSCQYIPIHVCILHLCILTSYITIGYYYYISISVNVNHLVAVPRICAIPNDRHELALFPSTHIARCLEMDVPFQQSGSIVGGVRAHRLLLHTTRLCYAVLSPTGFLLCVANSMSVYRQYLIGT